MSIQIFHGNLVLKIVISKGILPVISLHKGLLQRFFGKINSVD